MAKKIQIKSGMPLGAFAYAAADVIRRQPTVDAELVRHERFCPGCGARMDGGADNAK